MNREVKGITGGRRILIVVIGIIGVLATAPVMGSVMAYTIEVPDFSFDGLPVSVECGGLTTATIYTIYADADLVKNFTTGTGQKETDRRRR